VLLASQRGLIANGERNARTKSKAQSYKRRFRGTGSSKKSTLLHLSSFYCHPGKPGDIPFGLDTIDPSIFLWQLRLDDLHDPLLSWVLQM
jgi:hypothetical protein